MREKSDVKFVFSPPIFSKHLGVAQLALLDAINFMISD